MLGLIGLIAISYCSVLFPDTIDPSAPHKVSNCKITKLNDTIPSATAYPPPNYCH